MDSYRQTLRGLPRRRIAILAWLVVAILRPPSIAQEKAVNSVTSAAPATQTVWEVGDVYLPGSHVYVLVGKTGVGHEHGVVGELKQGRINLGAARDAGSLTFDMASFSADTPEARKFVGLPSTVPAASLQQVTTTMKGAEILDVPQFPTAKFTIKQINKLDKSSKRNLPQCQLGGDFSLHGVTRPIQVVAEVEEQTGWTHLMGGFAMLQSQFGIKPFKKAFGAVGVTDQLTVWGDLWVSKQRQMTSPKFAAH
jgi:polyisoprenoid-binding protein YceI